MPRPSATQRPEISQNLITIVVSASRALATRTRDVDDLRLLADILGVESADTALQICADFYPDEPVSPRSGSSAGTVRLIDLILALRFANDQRESVGEKLAGHLP
jgi:hypothetical protein